MGDVRRVEPAAAVGTAVRQRRFVNLIDPIRGGRLAVGLGAVASAGLAARLLGLARRLAFDEGSGLALDRGLSPLPG
jgi:hypothetical protein